MSVTQAIEKKMHVEKYSKNYEVAVHLTNGKAYYAALSYIGGLSNPRAITFRTVEEMKEAGHLILDAVNEIEQALTPEIAVDSTVT